VTKKAGWHLSPCFDGRAAGEIWQITSMMALVVSPTNEVFFSIDSRTYAVGNFDGYCSPVAKSLLTDVAEIDALNCSFTESGTLIGIFSAGDQWVVKVRDWYVSEFGPETQSGGKSTIPGVTSFRTVLSAPMTP
jgi:hypothetical protein